MTEKQIRARLAQLEQELADEKAKNERAQQTIADLAQAAAWGSLPQPEFTPPPTVPPPVEPIQLPWAITYYACAFPSLDGPPPPPPTITWTSTAPLYPPKGSKAK